MATAQETAGRVITARAARYLSEARRRQCYPPVRIAALRLLDTLSIRTPLSLANLAQITGGQPGDLREDIEALAYALILYAPGTLRVKRTRPKRVNQRGGRGADLYQLVLAPRG